MSQRFTPCSFGVVNPPETPFTFLLLVVSDHDVMDAADADDSFNGRHLLLKMRLLLLRITQAMHRALSTTFGRVLTPLLTNHGTNCLLHLLLDFAAASAEYDAPEVLDVSTHCQLPVVPDLPADSRFFFLLCRHPRLVLVWCRRNSAAHGSNHIFSSVHQRGRDWRPIAMPCGSPRWLLLKPSWNCIAGGRVVAARSDREPRLSTVCCVASLDGDRARHQP